MTEVLDQVETSRSPDDASEDSRTFRVDRRTGAERRSWEERRGSDSEKGDERDERRGGQDRRVMLFDRRHGIFEPYSLHHAEQIRKMVLDPGSQAVMCPRCGGDLVLGMATVRDLGTSREVHCVQCRHGVLISELPAEVDSPSRGTAT